MGDLAESVRLHFAGLNVTYTSDLVVSSPLPVCSSIGTPLHRSLSMCTTMAQYVGVLVPSFTPLSSA